MENAEFHADRSPSRRPGGRLATSCTSLRSIASAKLSKSFATVTNEDGPPITFLR